MRHLTRILISTIPLLFAIEGRCQDPVEPQWQALFDGESLAGWRQLGGAARYHAEDGCIVGTTVAKTPNSFLCTEREYGDFALELEYLVDPGLNSGIQIRSQSRPARNQIRVYGYQVEIDPSARAWSAGIYDEARRGWLNDLKANEPARKAFRQGEWNHYRIVCIGDRLRTWINGVPAADLVDSLTLKGFIGLQVHGVGDRTEPLRVRWRNLRIQDLGEHRWVPLFDGKSLSGWRALPGGSWEVRSGVLFGESSLAETRHGVLLSEKRYGDFTMRIRYRLLRGNSGLYFRVDEVAGDVGVHGLQAEIDSKQGAGRLYETGGRARIGDWADNTVMKHFKPGTENIMTVSAHGRRIVVLHNDRRTAELREDTGRLEGHLGIQLHGRQEMAIEIHAIELLERVPPAVEKKF